MRLGIGTSVRRLLIALGAMVAALLAVCAIVWTSIGRMEAADISDREAREELIQDTATLEAMIDEQTGVRGFVMTGDPRFLQAYDTGRRRLGPALARLTQLAADDPPAMRAAAARVVLAARGWSEAVATPVLAAARAGRPAALDVDDDKRRVDAIRADIDRLRAGESELLFLRDARQAAAFHSSRLALLAGTGAAMTFALLIAGLSFWRVIRGRRKAERTARRLEEALERAQSAECAKTVFLSNMSHEMRTPLNGILGMADALAGTHLKVPQREMLEVIRIGAVTLDALIADLLALTRGKPVDEARMGQLFETLVHVDAVTAAAAAEAPAPSPEPHAADPACEDRAPRVLIVDDNATNRRVLELILDQLGLEWSSVEDGRQAVDAAQRQDFAAILMDIQMPVMDGLSATREIRRLEAAAQRPGTPVIIVSANGQPEHIQAGRAAGAQAHLTKPVSAEMLVGALNAVLAGPEAVDEAA